MKRLIVVLLLLLTVTTIAQGGVTGLIVMWDIETGEQVIRIDRELPVIDARLSPNGQAIIIEEQDGYRYVLDAASGEERFSIEPHSLISQDAWYATNTRLIFWWSNFVDIYDLRTGQMNTLELPDTVFGARSGRRTSRILTWTYDGKARLLGVGSGREIRVFDHLEEGDFGIPVLGAEWNANETRLVTWMVDGRAMMWNALTGERLFEFEPLVEGEALPIANMEWSGDGNYLLAYAFENAEWVWDAQTGEVVSQTGHIYSIEKAEWNTDSTMILSKARNGTIWTWDPFTGEMIYEVELEGRFNIVIERDTLAITPFINAEWSPTGTHFMTWGLDSNGEGYLNVIPIADLTQTNILVHSFPTMFNSLEDAAWFSDGVRILSRTIGAPGVGAAWVWDSMITDGSLLEGRICCGEFMGASLSDDETKVIAWGQVSDVCGC